MDEQRGDYQTQSGFADNSPQSCLTENTKTEIPGIFLVTSWVEQDLKQIFNVIKPPSFDMDHVKIVLYNLLCSIYFL
jgi:hypothetical protein